MTIVLAAVGVLMAINAAIGKPLGDEDADVDTKDREYLVKFGYFKVDSRHGSLGGAAGAIRKFQRFANIVETGVIDAATKKVMEEPRCGMPESGIYENTKRKRRYTAQGSSWTTKSNLSWYLENDNNDGLSRATVESVMKEAFNKWKAVTNLDFYKIEYPNSKRIEADIKVEFRSQYHGDHYPFDGPGGTLAHAFYPFNNYGLAGDVHFDDDETFSLNSKSGKNLLWIATHELGHSLGLEHSDVEEALMYPWYRGSSVGNNIQLHPDDVQGIRSIYGTRNEKRFTDMPEMTNKNDVTMPDSTCPRSFNAVVLDKNTGITYAINGNKVFKLSKILTKTLGPQNIVDGFPTIRKNVDAAYTKQDGSIVFITGKTYQIIQSFQETNIAKKSGSIYELFNGLKESEVPKIDGAFVWSPNGRTYLFSGENYYRFNEQRGKVDIGYPRKISDAWKNVPSDIDSVVEWNNGVTYFFKGEEYYRLSNKALKVESGYPRSIPEVWSKCKTIELVRQKVPTTAMKSDQGETSPPSGSSAIRITSNYHFLLSLVIATFVLKN